MLKTKHRSSLEKSRIEESVKSFTCEYNSLQDYVRSLVNTILNEEFPSMQHNALLHTLALNSVLCTVEDYTNY